MFNLLVRVSPRFPRPARAPAWRGYRAPGRSGSGRKRGSWGGSRRGDGFRSLERMAVVQRRGCDGIARGVGAGGPSRRTAGCSRLCTQICVGSRAGDCARSGPTTRWCRPPWSTRRPAPRRLRRVRWQNRAQFFAIAARLMRQILVDHARAHVAAKRGGPGWKVPLTDDLGVTVPREVHLLDLDAAPEKLATIDSRLGELVVLRFFGGMTSMQPQRASGYLLPQSSATGRAPGWLFRELRRVVK